MLVRETASALRGLGVDPAGLVVACRRIVERHPASGPLWWLCSSLLASSEPFPTANRLADLIEDDTTPEVLVDGVAPDATVCVLGWPDLAGEAALRRGDVTVLAVDVADEGRSFVRRLERADVAAEVVEPAGIGAAVLASDVVLVEALATTASEAMAVQGSLAAAAVGWCAEVPVWLVAGRGRSLPPELYAAMVERRGDRCQPWLHAVDLVPLTMVNRVVRPDGIHPVERARDVLRPECPVAHELLRQSPM